MLASSVAETLDTLMTLDLAGRGIGTLYRAARARAGGPLAWTAAERLAAVPTGSFIVLGTGWLTRGAVSSRLAENDGPSGAAVIARALALGREVTSVVVAEAGILPALGAVCRAAGLSLLELDEARRIATVTPRRPLAAVVLWPLPADDAQAGHEAARLLDEVRPALLLAAERPGRSASGVYHNQRGGTLGDGVARVDLLFEAAAERGLPTIGVGDGGNEIGMGAIGETVRQVVAFGDRCRCGCGAGIGARTATDVLVTATCSNWGCYAVAAALAAQLRRPDLLHTPAREAELQHAGVIAGLLNTPRGTVDPNVDDIPLGSHLAVVELMQQAVLRAG